MRKKMLGRRLLAGLFAIASAAILLPPLGCEAPPPPKAPDAPEAPTVDLKPPELPKPPEPPKPGGCCVKAGTPLSDEVCEPKGAHCCSGKVEGDACEEKGGKWYFSFEGCKGMG